MDIRFAGHRFDSNSTEYCAWRWCPMMQNEKRQNNKNKSEIQLENEMRIWNWIRFECDKLLWNWLQKYLQLLLNGTGWLAGWLNGLSGSQVLSFSVVNLLYINLLKTTQTIVWVSAFRQMDSTISAWHLKFWNIHFSIFVVLV